MILYVESNFVLQIALAQEEAQAAQSILAEIEQRKCELAFPVFALSEPFSTISYHGVERRNMYNLLNSQLAQLQRSQQHRLVTTTLQSLLAMWLQIELGEMAALQQVVKRMLVAGRLIQLDRQIFEQALTYQDLYGLAPQDSIIYASIITDMSSRDRTEDKCFVSSNYKDFGDPGIKAELKQFGCSYISKFADALRFIRRA